MTVALFFSFMMIALDWNEEWATMMVQGAIETGSLLQFWLVCPLMIAFENRATLQITPALTILSANIVMGSFMAIILTEAISLAT